jgi:hypothetical protein
MRKKALMGLLTTKSKEWGLVPLLLALNLLIADLGRATFFAVMVKVANCDFDHNDENTVINFPT